MTDQTADRPVAYRSPGTRALYCVTCARQETGWQPVTEVRDDAVCDFCGGRVLAVASRTLGAVVARYAGGADRAALRERIAEALYERERPPRDPHWADAYAMDRETFEEMADAVLAVLPAPTDQAAALSEAERTMLAYALDQAQEKIWSEDGFTDEDQAAVDSLRRLAGEAQQDRPPVDRAAVYAEVAARLAADAEQGDKDGLTRIYRRSAARQVREWADEARTAREAQQDEVVPCVRPEPHPSHLHSGIHRERGVVHGRCPGVPAREAQQDPTQDGTEAHPPQHAWKVESPRRDQWASWGATYDDRDWACERYEDAISTAPARPFRMVRATTTYTVEAEHTPAAVARPGQPDTDGETAASDD